MATTQEKRITAQEILTLREQGHVAYVYPRLGKVEVDGYQVYTITQASMDTLKHWNNGKVN